MSYNFRDQATPTLTTSIDSAGNIVLNDGDDQGDLLTQAFTGSQVAVSIEPPAGYNLDSVVWDDGNNGVFAVPAEGNETSTGFTFTVSQPTGGTLTDSGSFKVKKQGGTGGGS